MSKNIKEIEDNHKKEVLEIKDLIIEMDIIIEIEEEVIEEVVIMIEEIEEIMIEKELLEKILEKIQRIKIIKKIN